MHNAANNVGTGEPLRAGLQTASAPPSRQPVFDGQAGGLNVGEGEIVKRYVCGGHGRTVHDAPRTS